MVLNDAAEFDLAVRLREGGAALADVFAFISGLYFRGKAAYAAAFARPPAGMPGSLVIAAGRGFLPGDTVIGPSDLREIAAIPIDITDARYRRPLEQAALGLHKSLGPTCEVVLLGSIATSKYLEPLVDVFGTRLKFPAAFIGRGDMSRGGLMLRCAREGEELEYVAATTPLRRGRRPPRLQATTSR